jgi:hypothetical protein
MSLGVGVEAAHDPGPAALPRGRGDAGTGLVSLLGGVLVFLIFLLFACHLLIGLYARSVVAGAAFDGAQHLARHERDVDGAERVVEAQLGSAKGLRTKPSIEADYVEYTVEIDPPQLLMRTWVPGSDPTISRTARVRIEKKR